MNRAPIAEDNMSVFPTCTRTVVKCPTFENYIFKI